MKALSILNPHPNVSAWVDAANRQAIDEVISIINAECSTYPRWALSMSHTRLRQLCTEILTMKLQQVSDGQWKGGDFAGPSHSGMITRAITDVFEIARAHLRVMQATHEN